MNQYGKVAQQHWATYRPAATAALGSPQEQAAFFTALGLRVAQQIGSLTEDLLAKQPPADGYLAQVQARTQAQSQARELVLHDEVFLPAEPGMENAELPDNAIA